MTPSKARILSYSLYHSSKGCNIYLTFQNSHDGEIFGGKFFCEEAPPVLLNSGDINVTRGDHKVGEITHKQFNKTFKRPQFEIKEISPST